MVDHERNGKMDRNDIEGTGFRDEDTKTGE